MLLRDLQRSRWDEVRMHAREIDYKASSVFARSHTLYLPEFFHYLQHRLAFLTLD